MKALLDTCVILDALQNRAGFAQEAQEIFIMTANNQITGAITAKAVTDIYYLMHRHTHDDKVSRDVLNKLFSLFEVLDTAGMDCKHAALSQVSDYEDAVMAETAKRTSMDCIVTRNVADYKKAGIPVFTPKELIAWIRSENDG